VRLRPSVRLERRMCVVVFLLVVFGAPTVSGQGSAPETAPPLFPGGGLISYNSIFTTRGFPEVDGKWTSPGLFCASLTG